MSGSFDEFYAAHFGPLVVQLQAGTGDFAEAQDVVQEAFCRAWGRWDRLIGYDDPVAWVRRVAWNLAISRWRRTRTALRFVARQRVESVAGPDPDRVALTAALARLPVKQRRAVALFYLADLSTNEIAQECGVPESTVRSWLHRARAALLKDLSDPVEEIQRGSVG
ncbi:SigE family RNA polymerase sigma factor [Rugosimonospora acidiphila]|uniref:SigE family RNA polymerase sigma factor n=1 Tax=Rugosimonospora acidiphila TaxID=556531 RepID=A0ABP9SDX1_9ACTN